VSWWNDVASVARVNSVAQAATAFLAVLAAITGVVAWATSSRLETLRAHASTPRTTLLRAHRGTVVEHLAPVPPSQVRIETALGDLEGIALAEELSELLLSRSWPVARIDQSTQSGEFLDGVVVQYAPTSPEGANLARGLRAAGIPAVSRRDALTTGVIVRIGTELE